MTWDEQWTTLDEQARNGIARPPPPETIAAFLRLQRRMMGWKKQVLASLAGVSLATVERAERGLRVSDASLERLAAALHQAPGAFTEPRVPLGAQEACDRLDEWVGKLADSVPVSVRPLRGQRQIAELAKAGFMLCDTRNLDGALRDDAAQLVEWLDLASFLVSPHGDREFDQRRKLYRNMLDCASRLRGAAKAELLVGTYTADTNIEAYPQAQVAVVSAVPFSSDPAATKRRVLFAPAKVFFGPTSQHPDPSRSSSTTDR